jgi:uncharacterized protein
MMLKRFQLQRCAALALALAALAACGDEDKTEDESSAAVPVPGRRDDAATPTKDKDAGRPPRDATDARVTSMRDASASRNPDDVTPGVTDTGLSASDSGPGQSDAEAEPSRASCTELTTETTGGSATPYPGGRWTVPEPTFGSVIQTGVRIAMSDGIELVGDVTYPAELGTQRRAAGTFPVILTQNPYGGTFGAASGEIFVTHGYIFASIDVRGTSRSQGVHDMFSPREAEDGAALVAWAAKLEGSDGKVGLQGCSQLGINQLETATQLGPHSPVKAMIPACGSGDFYRDTAFDNGIPTIVGSGLAGEDATTGGDKAYYREYWRTRDRVARAPAIARADIPTLLWAGWSEPGALGSLELYTALQNLSNGRPAEAPITGGQEVSGKYQVIMGDWSHAMGLDKGIELQWFDTWIKGIDTGLPTKTATPLHLAERGGTKRWVNARCYPITERYTPLYLAGERRLERNVDAEKSHAELKWVAPGQSSEVLEYTSEPFAEGVMLAGPPAAQLEVSSSNRNVQLVVDIFDKAPDGKLVKVSHGSILGSLRRTDEQKSWSDENGLPARPYLTLDEDQFLTPGEPTKLDVPLWPTVWSFEAGHSIVLRLSTQPATADCQNLLGVPVGCYPTTPMRTSLEGGTYTVHHGVSLLSIPLLDHGALPTSQAKVSPTGKVTDPFAVLLGATEFPLPIDW